MKKPLLIFRIFREISKTMRVSILLLLFSIGILQAENSYSQSAKITLSIDNEKVAYILEAVELQSEFTFVYDSKVVDTERKASVNVADEKVFELLEQLFLGTDVAYTVVNNKVILNSKEDVIMSQQDDKITIRGVVSDSEGEALPGAVVIAKEGSRAVATTDLDGKYSISVTEGTQLEFSYIGYITQTLNPNSRSVLDVTLKIDSELLEEVVVVGYGTQRKSDITGAISHVNMEEVVGDRPVVSITQALQSAVPGLQISQNSARVGSGTNINIRGVTSINSSGAQPLVLVDNVPMDIDMLDPNDIKSVTVLKDASSAAIYGARAAYGIILIETKQGKRDMPLSLNYSNNFSFSKVASLPQMMDPLTTVEFYDDLGYIDANGGQHVPTWLGLFDEYNNHGMHQDGVAYVDKVRYGLAATDVYSDMMADFGFQQRHNVSMSGGSERANYRASFGAIDEDGILHTDQDSYSRYNASAFMNLDITDWLSGQVDMSYSQSSTSEPNTKAKKVRDLWQIAYDYRPADPIGYGYAISDLEKEELLPYTSPRNALELDNPIISRKSNTRILGRLILNPIEGLKIVGEYSYYRMWGSTSSSTMQYNTLSPSHHTVEKSLEENTYYEMQNWFSNNNSLNAYATYDKSFNDEHNLKVMVGYNMESYHYENLYGRRDDLIDNNLPSLSLASGAQMVNDSFAEYALMSGFYRVNYDYKSRYLLTMSGRYDGSSRFADGNKFGFFPSVSAGWNISKEPFMKSINKTVSNLKLRASWGTIGNQNVSNYGYLGIMNSSLTNWVLPGSEQKTLTVGRPTLVSAIYTWESVETFDIGLDVGLAEDRLQMVFDWYQRNTNDMLAPASAAPSVLGVAFPQTNSASLKTTGWEVSVQWKDAIGDFNYYIGANLYDSKSIITKYDNARGILLSGNNLVLREGLEFGEIWGYNHDRLYTAADFDAQGNLLDGIPRVQGITTPNPGDVLYVDQNGDGVINNGTNVKDDSGDLVRLGNNSARYQYGITGGFSYKGFSLSFLFSGVGKRDLVMPGYYPSTGLWAKNIHDWQMDYWMEDNLDSYWPRLYGDGGNNEANNKIQDKYILDASYFKLQNLTLGYTFSKSFCEKIALDGFRVFVTGENLFTVDHLPEGYYPYNFVAQPGSLDMTSRLRGGDGHGNWAYPQMMQFSFGFNITF